LYERTRLEINAVSAPDRGEYRQLPELLRGT
jgi:hypothetical protein